MALGIKRVWRRTNHTRRRIVTVKREFYYIPIQDSLNVSDHVTLYYCCLELLSMCACKSE